MKFFLRSMRNDENVVPEFGQPLKVEKPIIVSSSVEKDNELDSNVILTDSSVESFINSKVVFHGQGNHLVLEPGAKLQASKIEFFGNNSLVYVSKSRWNVKLNVLAFHDSVLFVGANCSYGAPVTVNLSERKSVIVGDDCMLSYGVSIRTSDVHLVYSAHDGKRLNRSQSVVVGDHVWLGQDALVLKGARIGSGAIIGARSTVTGAIPSNSSAGGTPARVIRTDIFWERPSVHAFDETASELHDLCTGRENVFTLYTEPSCADEALDVFERADDVDVKISQCERLRSVGFRSRFVV